MNLDALDQAPRVLLEATLRPVQGDRFQPTGFPDLGPATYTLPDGTEMLLVESPQSMANRLESVCWDESAGDLVPEVAGLPYIRVVDGHGEVVTNSLLEAHRINSPYILESEDKHFFDKLAAELEAAAGKATDRRLLARTVFRYDPNAVLHGLFLAKKQLAGGRFRLPRLLSAFVEAREVRPAESGGVKNDRVNPSGETASGFGNVPFHRTEFVAGAITAYVNFDLTTLRSYGLDKPAEKCLLLLGLWKVRRLLDGSLRFRTACDLDCMSVCTSRPEGFELPRADELAEELQAMIGGCAEAGLFASPAVTEVCYVASKKRKSKPASDRSAELAG